MVEELDPVSLWFLGAPLRGTTAVRGPVKSEIEGNTTFSLWELGKCNVNLAPCDLDTRDVPLGAALFKRCYLLCL